MAFQDLNTTQPDQDDGDPVSSAYLQQNSENHNWFHDEKPICRVMNSGAQSIPNSSATALTFDTEEFDTGTMHSTVTNTSRIVVPVPGIYLVGGAIQWASNATGQRTLAIAQNGTPVPGMDDQRAAISGASSRNRVCELIRLAANDYLELQATQTSGGSLNTGTSSAFWVIWQAGSV